MIHRESSTSFMCLKPTTSYSPVVSIRKFVVQIPSTDKILMGYWVVSQVRTMMSSVMYKSKFRMRYMILRKVLVITCEMFLGDHLRNTRIIDLLGSGRGIFGGLGDEL